MLIDANQAGTYKLDEYRTVEILMQEVKGIHVILKITENCECDDPAKMWLPFADVRLSYKDREIPIAKKVEKVLSGWAGYPAEKVARITSVSWGYGGPGIRNKGKQHIGTIGNAS